MKKREIGIHREPENCEEIGRRLLAQVMTLTVKLTWNVTEQC